MVICPLTADADERGREAFRIEAEGVHEAHGSWAETGRRIIDRHEDPMPEVASVEEPDERIIDEKGREARCTVDDATVVVHKTLPFFFAGPALR